MIRLQKPPFGVSFYGKKTTPEQIIYAAVKKSEPGFDKIAKT